MQGSAYGPLLFIKRDATQQYVWCPDRSQTWSKDNETGCRYADELCDYISAEHMPPLLCHVVKMIMQNGVFSGVEVGFFDRLATKLTASATGDN